MADASETPDEPMEPTSQHIEAATDQPDIDIEALAEKVYRLMLAEIRLDRARGLASDQGV
jgi:hypothetical protein